MIPFNGWTIFSINDGTNTVRIDCTSIDTNIVNGITFVPLAKAPASQPLTGDPETVSLDLKKITHTLNIDGYIVDDTDNSGDTVPQKKLKLQYMAERKKAPFSATYRGETYSNNIYLTGVKFKDNEDNYMRSSGTLIDASRIKKLKVTLELRRATRR